MLEINLKLQDRPKKAIQYKNRTILTRKDGEYLVIMMQHKMFKLNRYLTEIYELCDGELTAKDIVTKIADKYSLDKCQKNKIKEFIQIMCQKEILKI